MERSSTLRARIGKSRQAWLAWLVVAAGVVGCAYPDYTYVDKADGASGSGGTGGTGGSGGSGGATGGTGATGATGGTGGTETGGAAGVAGEGGTGGTAGVAGAAGVAGEAGTGGASGSAGEGGVDAGDAGDADASDDADASIEADVAEADAAEEEAAVETGPEASDCPTTVENCTNGIDDNCDGKVDCADPQCSPLYRCVPPVPTGWQGFYSLYDGAVGASAPSCGAPFSSIAAAGFRNLSWQPATCSTCQCGLPSDVACEEPELYLVVESTCNGTAWHLSDPTEMCGETGNEHPCWGVKPHGECRSVNLNPGTPPTYPSAVYFKVGQPVPGTGTCQPSGGVPAAAAPSWGRFGIGCEADSSMAGAGCTPSYSCVPKSPTAAGYEQGTCIYQPGEVAACPSGSPFSKRFVYYLDWVDTRDCADCQCGTPAVSSCTGSLTVALDNTCPTTGPNAEAFITSSSGQGRCEPITGATTHNIKYDDVGVTGQCLASGGGVTGEVRGVDTTATTFCCLLF